MNMRANVKVKEEKAGERGKVKEKHDGTGSPCKIQRSLRNMQTRPVVSGIHMVICHRPEAHCY